MDCRMDKGSCMEDRTDHMSALDMGMLISSVSRNMKIPQAHIGKASSEEKASRAAAGTVTYRPSAGCMSSMYQLLCFKLFPPSMPACG